MKLYHVSRDISKIIKEFIPSIPSSSLLGGEDRTIKRICLSDDIELCVGAIGYALDKDIYIPELDSYKPLRVYEFNVPDEDLIKPEEVNKYVPDSLITHEYWYTKGILKPTCNYIILPTYFIRRTDYVNMVTMFEFEKV